MAVLIKSVSITPDELFIGEMFKISVRAEEPMWSGIKTGFKDWKTVKNSFENWKTVNDFKEK